MKGFLEDFLEDFLDPFAGNVSSNCMWLSLHHHPCVLPLFIVRDVGGWQAKGTHRKIIYSSLKH